MVAATLMALGAAVLHTAWNLAAKRSVDRFGALWAQFVVAAVLAGVILCFSGLPPSGSLKWAAISGVVHVPYIVFLARAYDKGEFSLVYPVARGGGVVLATIGGALLLDDRLGVGSWIAIGIIVVGLFALTPRAVPDAVFDALVVAATIGVYTLADAKGARVAQTDSYVFVGFVLMGAAVSIYGLLTRRQRSFVTAVRAQPLTVVASGLATVLTYALVVAAFRRAPVGYVVSLRECSVVLAAVIGWRFLGEASGPRRVAAACTVAAGVVLLVLAA
jgi:uncharacterized membrane protein